MKRMRGFTLIELVIVVVIIGILAGAVVPNILPRLKQTQINRAKGDISVLSSAIDLYALDNNNSYPKTLELLVPKYSQRLWISRPMAAM